MKRVIKNKKKMKNTMYIVFGTFALLLFMITRTNPSFAEEGLIIDDALDAIMQGTEMYGSGGFEKVEEEKLIQPVEENEGEDRDIVEPKETLVEEIEEGDEIPQDLEDVNLEGDDGDEGDKKDDEDRENKEVNEGRGNRKNIEQTEEVENGDNNVDKEVHGVNNENTEIYNEKMSSNEETLILENVQDNQKDKEEENDILNTLQLKNNNSLTVFSQDNPYIIYDEENGLITVYSQDFSYGITLQDKNLGAENVGDRGNFYKRGNNEPIPNNNTDSSKVSDNNSWGGGNDNNTEINIIKGYDTINHKVTNLENDNRKGPCPDGYHIPSQGEASELIKLYYQSIGSGDILNIDENGLYSIYDSNLIESLFARDLKMPLVGYRKYWETTLDSVGQITRFWLSTPHSQYENFSYFLTVGKTQTTPKGGDGRAILNSLRCFKNDYIRRPKTVVYNANGGTFSGGLTEKQFIYNYSGSDIIPIYNIQIPNKEQIGETGWMFAGWYTESGINGDWGDEFDISNPQTNAAYAKWLPFEELTLTIGSVKFTIMDRNLGAEAVSYGEYNQFTPAEYAKYGYYYQWGNNYGFKILPDIRYINSEKVGNLPEKERGPGNYYYSNIYRYYNGGGSRWTEEDLRNLWGGENKNSSEMDKQGPCPTGYHVPEIYEWETILKLFEKENTNNPEYCNGFSTNEKYKCIANKLKMPFAGYWSGPSYHPTDFGQYMRYWSSSPDGSNTSFHLWLYNNSYSTKERFAHTTALPVRCFKNSEENELKIIIDEEDDTKNYSENIIRWNPVINYKPLNPSKKGFTFMGWKINDIDYDFKSELFLTGLSLLKAQWDKNPWYHFNSNGGRINGSSENQIIKSDTIIKKKISHTDNIYDDGASFKGLDWNMNVNDIITITGATTLKISLKYGGNSNPTNWSKGDCLVIWTGSYPEYTTDDYENSITQKLCTRTLTEGEYIISGNTITIAYSTDGSKDGAGIDYGYYAVITDYDYNEDYIYKINEEIPNPTNPGHEFLGWYEEDSEAPFDFTGTEVTQDRTFYAKWNANTYAVSFNADNGETNPGNITVTYDSQYPELPVVNKTGYTFLGWYNGEEKVSSGDIVKVIEDVTLRAKWDINQYKIIFDTDGGNKISPIEKDYNSILTSLTLPTPTKECNEFSGWDAELPGTMPAHDITLKAIWNYTCSKSSGAGGRKSDTITRDIAIDTNTENEHNSADEKDNVEKAEENKAVTNNETSNQVISVMQEISEDGTVEAVIETVKIRNTDIIATVRTEVNPSDSSSSSSNSTTHIKEQKDAYSFAKSNGITTTKSIETAKMDTELTRIEMAKMVSNYAINVLGQEPDTSKGTVQFKDVTEEMNKQYDNAVTKAYQLGIMGQNVNDNKFRPNDEVSRAEFSATLSRLLYHTEEGKYRGTGKYYVPHIAKLYNEGIINKVIPTMKERRGYVMTMLMRTVK